MSLGMTLIRANTLAIGLIGKDGTHGITKICFENMNLVFGNIRYEKLVPVRKVLVFRQINFCEFHLLSRYM